jgi:cytochrome c biogenesis protein CcmG, thiol:disulfide interchange protein DsbE
MTTKTPSKSQQQPKSRTWLWITGGVVGLGLIVGLAYAISGEEQVDASVGFGDVTVEGNALPAVENPNAGDPTIGFVAPTISGADWEGNEFTIGPDGRSKIVVLLAHWCPHCQADVPVVQSWIDEGGLPDDVDFYGVTVLTNSLRPEFPPQDWLESEGWTSPTIMDSENGEVALAYGLTGTPYYIILDGQNRNLGRISGQVGEAGLNAMVSIAQTGLSTPPTTAPAP